MQTTLTGKKDKMLNRVKNALEDFDEEMDLRVIIETFTGKKTQKTKDDPRNPHQSKNGLPNHEMFEPGKVS